MIHPFRLALALRAAVALGLLAGAMAPARAEDDEGTTYTLERERAWIEFLLADDAQLTLGARERGLQRQFGSRKLAPDELCIVGYRATFADGRQVNGEVLVRPGWRTRVPVRPDEPRLDLVARADLLPGPRVVVVDQRGQRIATGYDDGRVVVWDMTRGVAESMLEGHSASVSAVAFSGDGQWLVTGSKDKTAIVWSLADRRPHRRLDGHDWAIASVAFSTDSRRVLTASEDGTIATWDIPKGRRLDTSFVPGLISASFSPLLAQCAIGTLGEATMLYSLSPEHHCRTLDPRSRIASVLAFTRDGQRLLVGAENKSAVVLDVASGEKVCDLVGHRGKVEALAFSLDGRLVLTGSSDGGLFLWDVSDGLRLRSLSGHRRAIRSVAFARNGHHVLSASADGTTRLWDLATGDELARLVARGGQWLVATPEGLYDGTEDTAGLAYRMAGREDKPLAQLAPEFRRDRLLVDLCRGERPMPATPIADDWPNSTHRLVGSRTKQPVK